jgi:hypothetical protein
MKATVANIPHDHFADRLSTAAAARSALIAAFKPKPTQQASGPIDRAGERAARLKQVRDDRAEAKSTRKAAILADQQAAAQAVEDLEAAALSAKRGERKERKALSAAEAKAKRDARYAARQARR